MNNSLEKLFGWCYPLLRKIGFEYTIASYLSLLINIALMCLLAYIFFIAFRYVLDKIFRGIARRTKNTFDDYVIENITGQYLFYLIPLLLVYKSVPVILEKYDYWEVVFGKIVGIWIVVLIIMSIRTGLNILRYYLKQVPRYSDKPIDSFIQVFNIMIWLFGITVIISKIFDINSKDVLTILGAISALIILIFRDTILGFVASVQVAINDMIRIGDWITMEKFGVDGDVVEINLATVKVRNFDNTTTTIPTYSLISDSFQNWRGMTDSDGRRIKRHILLKASSIRFLEESELVDLMKIELLSNYIVKRKTEIDKYNSSNTIDKSIAINGRNLTNLGLFRKYITQYLQKHPGINKDLVMICRQLQSTTYGVPLEVYAFSKDKKFENYEYIMADIFDHIIAAVPYFGLEISEIPTEKVLLKQETSPLNGL
jgi:miniconductance mechanosensitive channel